MEAIIKNTHDKKLCKKYHITLPQQLIDKQIDDFIEKAKDSYNLKGFRKGNVPAKIIKEKHHESIMRDEAEKLIDATLKKIVTDNKYKLALQPNVEIKKIAINQDIEIEVTFELFPELSDIDLGKIKITKYEVEIGKDEVAAETKKFLKYFTKWIEQDQEYKSKLNDAVNIDYVGKIDDKEFSGGSAQNQQLELGSKSFIDDFEEQLVGKKAGDNVKVKVKFPKDYHNSEFAGKSAEFAVKINKVLSAQQQEINDEFIKNNIGYESVADFEKFIEQQLQTKYQDSAFEAFKLELFDYLNKKYDFDLPQGLIDQQTKNLWQETEEELKVNPQKFKNDKEKDKAYEKKQDLAIKMIRCGICLNKICEDHKIQPSQEEIQNEFRKILSRFPGQEQKVAEYYQKNPETIENLKNSAREKSAINFVLSKENIEKKKIKTDDFNKFYDKLTKNYF